MRVAVVGQHSSFTVHKPPVRSSKEYRKGTHSRSGPLAAGNVSAKIPRWEGIHVICQI